MSSTLNESSLSGADLGLLTTLGMHLSEVAEALQQPGAVAPERASVVWPLLEELRVARQRDACEHMLVLRAANALVDCAVAARGVLPTYLESVLHATRAASPGLHAESSAALSRRNGELDPDRDPLQWLWRMYYGSRELPTRVPRMPPSLQQFTGRVASVLKMAHRGLHHPADGGHSPLSLLNPYYGAYQIKWADAAEAFVRCDAGESLLREARQYRVDVLERSAGTVTEAIALGRELATQGSTWLVSRGPLVLMKYKRDDEALALVDELLGDDPDPTYRDDLEKRRDRLVKRCAPALKPRPTSRVPRTSRPLPVEPGMTGRHPLVGALVESFDTHPDSVSIITRVESVPLRELDRELRCLERLDDLAFEAIVRRVERGLSHGDEQLESEYVATTLAERWDTGVLRQWRLFELDRSAVNAVLAWRLDLPVSLYRAILRRPAHADLGRTIPPPLHGGVTARARMARGWLATTVDYAPGVVLRASLLRQASRIERWHVARVIERCGDDLTRTATSVLDSLARAVHDRQDPELTAVVERAQDRSRPIEDLADIARVARAAWGFPARPPEAETDASPDDVWITWLRRGPGDPRPLRRVDLPWDAIVASHRDDPFPFHLVADLLQRGDVPHTFVRLVLESAELRHAVTSRLSRDTPALAAAAARALRDGSASAEELLAVVGAAVLVPVSEILARSADGRSREAVLHMLETWYSGAADPAEPALPAAGHEVERWLMDAAAAGLIDDHTLVRLVWPRNTLEHVLATRGLDNRDASMLAEQIANEALHGEDDGDALHSPCGTQFVLRQWPTWPRSLSELIDVADRVEDLGETDEQALAAYATDDGYDD